MITKQEENKVTLIAAISSILFLGIVIFLLIIWMIHVPNPPVFINELESGGGGGGGGELAVTLGTDDPKINDYVFPEPVNQTPVSSSSVNSDVVISDVNGVAINNTPTPTQTTNTTVTTQTTTTQNNTNPHANWQNALSGANNNTNDGGKPGSTGGVEGDVGTGPNFGPGNTGGNTGNTAGKTTSGVSGFGGTGRKALVMPCRPNITKREGKVVVVIKVDRNGNIVDADPNGPGTDTSDPELKLQARQAALCTKFEACTDCPEFSKGQIIFDFGYGNK